MKLAEGVSWNRGVLYVSLNPNRRLLFVDIAVGDMKLATPGADPNRLRGNGKLSVEIETDQSSLEIMSHENIGNSGVMRAIVPLEMLAGKNQRLRIRSSGSGRVSVMGIRLAY